MKCGADIHAPQRLNPHDFVDPLNLHVEPPAGQSIDLPKSSTSSIIIRMSVIMAVASFKTVDSHLVVFHLEV